MSAVEQKLAALSSSLDDLEAGLEPLLSRLLSDTLCDLDPVQQAKLHVLITYLVYDLVFIYLKTRDIDPKTHPVVAELDRVRQYLAKIKQAEDPDTRRAVLDKTAASRFIKHAISAAQIASDDASPSQQEAGPSGPSGSRAGASSSTHIRFDSTGTSPIVDAPVKVTSKMRERAEYERHLREKGSEEEEEILEVFDGDELDTARAAAPGVDALTAERKERRRKGKDKAVASEASSMTGSPAPERSKGKRKRARIDPFAGYAADAHTPSQPRKSVNSSTHV